jgi:multidrug transporter EmrE-like cation transporter
MNPLWFLAGIGFSAIAQLGLKLLSNYSAWSVKWMLGMTGCVASYGMAFLLYSYILRHAKITVAGPLMTVGVVCVVVIGGLIMGESVSFRQCVGIGMALISVWFLMA